MQVMQDLTANFMKTFGQWDGESYLSTPQPKNEEELNTYKLRLKLCIEETFELFEAMVVPEEYTKFEFILNDLNSHIEALTTDKINIDPVGVYDAITDISVINAGTANLLGLDLEKGFVEVMKSNMSKLDKDGKPIFREDGKIMKSNSYTPPRLDLVYQKYRYSYE